MMKLTCPSCGKELEIPEGLEEYSCLFCGSRNRVAPTPALEAPADFSGRWAELKASLPGTVTGYPEHYKKLSKKDFFNTFEAYENENRSLLKEMDALLSVHPQGAELGAGELCASFMDALEAHMTGNKRWKRNKSQVFFETKVVLAIFLTPLARKLKLDHAETFRRGLHKAWMERFPKENWEPGDYDVLASGYKKFKWCYITTATCRSEGKADDCAELMSFRAFRDGWLTEQGGQALIEEYYDKAPAIVACIDLCDDAQRRYDEIRQSWLQPCYEALQEGRMADCRDSYVAMVRTLENRYLS